jgi:putative alpha-1,2-mannosidase
MGDTTVSIDGRGAAASRPYVRAARLGGRAWRRPWVTARELRRAGRLRFDLQAEPASSWGTEPDLAPPSFPPGPVP